jgi:autoinducer 2-degrading protein
MLCNIIKVRIKPEKRQRFLDAIEEDALSSERNEPGCLRFNVLQDTEDENIYYFYEVYKDEAAVEAHRAAPHYAVWSAAREEAVEGAIEATHTRSVFPADRAYWGKV